MNFRKIVLTMTVVATGIGLAGSGFAGGEGYGKRAETELETGQRITEFRPDENLHGATVRGTKGEKLGEVERILENDAGTFVVLSSGGVLGVGEKQYLVPFRALNQEGAEGDLRLNIGTEELKNSPEFADTNADDPELGRKAHDFYGVSPYWSEDEAPQEHQRERMKMEGEKSEEYREESESEMKSEEKRY